MEINDLKKTSAVEQVTGQIIQWIDGGTYGIGERLPSEAKIAEQTSISRSSVREAIRLLSASGVLTVRHGSGTYVAALPSSCPSGQATGISLTSVLSDVEATIEDRMEFRISLEKIIAELIIRNATDLDIDQLKAKNQQLDTLCKNGASQEEQLETDLAFHRIMGKCTRNPLMTALYDQVMGFVYDEMYQLYNTGVSNGYISFLAHQRIIDALYHRDTAVAASAIADSVLTYNTLKNYKQP